MKNLKMIYSLLVVLVAGLFGACTSDPYTPGEVPAGPQVCFSNNNPEILEVSGDPEDNTKGILLTRMVTDKALDVYIIADAGEDKDVFEIADKVTFAAGESEANLNIKVNAAKMEENKVYTIQLLLADEKQGTPYGDSAFTAQFKLFPWDLVQTDDVKFGRFRGGDAFSGLFGDEINTVAEINASIYQHKTKKGVYMVKDPWLKMVVPTLGIESEEAATISGGFTHTISDLVINCTNPAKCYIEKQNMGLAYSLSGVNAGDLMIASDYHPESNPTGLAGTFEDGVIVFPAESILVGGSKYEDGEMFTSNYTGSFRVVFPGEVAMDYNISVKYLGMEVSSNLQNIITKFAINYGGDVNGIKYYFAEGNVLANPDEAINALINGTANDIREVAGFSKGGKTMELNTTIANEGLYTIVMAAVGNNGALVSKTVALESFYYSGLGNNNNHPCELTLSVGEYTSYNTDDANDEIGNHNAIGYNIQGKEIKELYISTWLTSELNEYLAKEGNSYQTLFEKDEVAPFTMEALAEVHSASGKNGALTNLDAESDYTVVVSVRNYYETTDIITKSFKTGVAPVYSGEFKVGKYHWKNVNSKGEIVSEAIVDIQSHQGSETRFVVSNLGYEDGSQWFATYDAEKGTMTLDGTVKGREKEGNLFGQEFGVGKFYDSKTQKEVEYKYAYVSRLEAGSNSPLVFNVDKDTKAICGQQNKLFAISLFNISNSSSAGTHCMFDNSKNTTIAPYVEGATE